MLINRRDFLKRMISIPPSLMLSRLLGGARADASGSPNLIILVLDALSATNMSLYGYRRKTTPQLEQFARRANVYHAHYAGGTFTTSGTASLLTGTYPWTHRAVNVRGLVHRSFTTKNLFHLFPSHVRVAFTQNYLANYLLQQFHDDLDRHLPVGAFSELAQYKAGSDLPTQEFRALTDSVFGDPPGSLLLGSANKYLEAYRANRARIELEEFQEYQGKIIFKIRDVFAGIADELARLDQPSLCYFHVYPPHDPYRPQTEFSGLFLDGWNPKPKPRHSLWKDHSTSRKTLNEQRLLYDQYLANADAAFGELVERLEASGVLDRSILIVTSDHGESFERGYLGHSGPYVYEPSIRIPLLIAVPGQMERRDYHSITTSVDILPTLLTIAGYAIPSWCEGRVLPGFGLADENGERVIFSMDGKNSSAFGDLPVLSVAMRKGKYKIIHYRGYNEEGDPYHAGVYELFDIASDPGERTNLAGSHPSILNELKKELLSAYDSARRLQSES